MLGYCSKCGRMLRRVKARLEEPCDYCQNAIKPVPDEYLNDDKVIIQPDLEQQFIEEYIKSSPEFDQYLFEHRAEDLFNRRMQRDAIRKSAQNKCFYCGSTKIKKISMFSRAVSTELWGLGSKKIGKQFHCNSCGADF